MCVSSQSIIINKSSYTSRSRALGASTLARRASNNRNSRASKCKASSSLECSAERSRKSTKLELVCEYRPGRPGFKSSLLRREDLGERWSLS